MQPQRTPSGLLSAVQRGSKSEVQRLIKRRANVSEADSDGFTCLMEAAANNHIQILSLLLESNADPTPVNRLGRSVLMEAACRGHPAIVLRLAQAHPPLNEVSEKHSLKLTALMEAASRGHTGAAFWLCEARADIDARNSHGDTALIMAAYNGRLSTVQMLIGQRANPMIVGDGGMNALQAASANGHVRVAEFLSDPRLVEIDFCNEIYCRFKAEHKEQLQDEVNYDAALQTRPILEPPPIPVLPKWSQTLIKIPLGLDRPDRRIPFSYSNADLLDITKYPNHYLRNPWYSVNLSHVGKQAQTSAFALSPTLDVLSKSARVSPSALRSGMSAETFQAFGDVMLSKYTENLLKHEPRDKEKDEKEQPGSLNFSAVSLTPMEKPQLTEVPKPAASRILYSRASFGFLQRHYAPKPLDSLPKFGSCTWIATEPTRISRQSKTERLAAFIRTMIEAEYPDAFRNPDGTMSAVPQKSIIEKQIDKVLGNPPELQTEEYVRAREKLREAVITAMANAANSDEEIIEYPRLTLYDTGTWTYSGDRLSGELEGTFELFLLATTSPDLIPQPAKLKSTTPDKFAGARRSSSSKDPSFYVVDMAGNETLTPEMMVESEDRTICEEAKADGKYHEESLFTLDRLTSLSPAHTRNTYYIRLTTKPPPPSTLRGYQAPVQVVGCILAKQLVLGKLVMEMHELAVPWWEC